MDDKNLTSEGKERGGNTGVPNPLEGFAVASTVGFAMAMQATQMWFGVMAGVARVSQDMFAPQSAKKAGEPAAHSNDAAAAVTQAKAAVRTVAADLERIVQDVVEVAAEVVAFKPVLEAAPQKIAKAAPEKVAKAERPKVAPKPKSNERRQPVVDELKASEAAPVAEAVIEAAPVAETAIEAAPVAVAPKASETAPAAPAPVVAAPVVAEALVEPVAPVSTPVSAAPVMLTKPRAPKAIDKPAAPDDLKLVAGVGPKLETVLNGLGVWTHAQIAAWEQEEIAWVDDYLGLNGRIARDGWTAQAAKLAQNVKAAPEAAELQAYEAAKAVGEK